MDKIEPCRICKRLLPHSTIPAHARRHHPLAFYNWLQSRTGFGMSELEHRAFRNVEVAVIRK